MTPSRDILTLGLGLEEPWKIVDQQLDTSKEPHELRIKISSDRGSRYPCPVCGQMCKAHDFKEFTWRHLNFFQHHCYLTAEVPRIKCEEHGVKRINVPWAREGSQFTLLFEQVAMLLVKEMPVKAAAKLMAITDKSLWRVVEHYVSKAMSKLDLSSLVSFGLDETSAKKNHKYVTIFIDLDRESQPVVFATPGKGKACLKAFKKHLKEHGGQPEQVVEVVCDMSPSFIPAVGEHFQEATITVDWFHVVKLFTTALDKVRRAERKREGFPQDVRWATLKGQEKARTEAQEQALRELESSGFATATAYRIKELLRWIRLAVTPQAAKWRITHFIRHAEDQIGDEPVLEPVQKALETFKQHAEFIARRWVSQHTNARLEGLNSLFQSAKARARGYRKRRTFITMIYLIGAPIGDLLEEIQAA
jgi:transposase